MPNLMQFGFPPLAGAVKKLVLVNIGIFVGLWIGDFIAPGLSGSLRDALGLRPEDVMSGHVWQVVSYSFIHLGILHLLFNMLSLWMFGSTLERDWGRSRFLQFYFFCVLGAALLTIIMSFSHLLGMSPNTLTAGASGGIYGLLVAFGMLYAETRVYVYGIFPIKAKFFAMIWVGIALFGALSEQGGIANVAHLGGALVGYLYIKFMPRRGVGFVASEGMYGVRNRYQRWKRRQAAKKFEVYMRKATKESDPEEPPRPNGDRRGPWVN